MKKIFCIVILCTNYILSCEAQFLIGPTVGINQYFISHKTDLEYINYQSRAKLSINYGLKTEFWFTKYLFLSTTHRFSSNKHQLILSDYQTMIGDIGYNKFNHIQNSITINKDFNERLSVGFGLNYMHNYSLKDSGKSCYGLFCSDTTIINKNFKINEWGYGIAISKAVNSIIFEMNYAFSRGIVHKNSHAILFNVSYLFKTNLKFSKKGLDCPRF